VHLRHELHSPAQTLGPCIYFVFVFMCVKLAAALRQAAPRSRSPTNLTVCKINKLEKGPGPRRARKAISSSISSSSGGGSSRGSNNSSSTGGGSSSSISSI
jgi:uncharacterized membrane protein YgcG